MILFKKRNYTKTTVTCPKCGESVRAAYQPYYGYMDLSAIHTCAINKDNTEIVITQENAKKNITGGGDIG